MGRLSNRLRKAQRAANERDRGGKAFTEPARRAQSELGGRGMAISLRELARRTVPECIDAAAWARNRRPLSVRPAWLGELVSEGRARLVSGVCEGCGCTDGSACEPFGCAWMNAAHTLCSACEDDAFGINPIRSAPE
jgi:hypothetical protein